MKDPQIVCRCEEVTLEELRELIARGLTTLDEIKRLSRCGMGPCQGRTCRPLVSQELARARGISLDQVEMPTFRPPSRPVKLGVIARAAEAEDADKP